MRRIEQRTDPELKGLRWSLLKDRDRLTAAQRANLDALIVNVTTKSDHPRVALSRATSGDSRSQAGQRRQRNWCANVMRSKADPMQDVARMICSHFDGIVA